MRVLILPLPFLVPAIFVKYLRYRTALTSQTTGNEIAHVFQPIRVVCYSCYCIHAFYFNFVKGKAHCTRSCVLELDPGEFIRMCSHQQLPQQMESHLPILWLSIAKPVFFLPWNMLLSLFQSI